MEDVVARFVAALFASIVVFLVPLAIIIGVTAWIYELVRGLLS